MTWRSRFSATMLYASACGAYVMATFVVAICQESGAFNKKHWASSAAAALRWTGGAVCTIALRVGIYVEMAESAKRYSLALRSFQQATMPAAQCFKMSSYEKAFLKIALNGERPSISTGTSARKR